MKKKTAFKENSWRGSRNLLLASFVLILLPISFRSAWNTDMLWMVATGNYILKNGIPYENPFTIASGMGIVIQQWLYAVIAALFAKLGAWGWVLLAECNAYLLFIACYGFLRSRGTGKSFSLIGCILLLAMFSGSLINTRPEAVTITLLLFEMTALEKYRETEKKGWLWTLPVGMLLESNLHSSMVYFHFTVLAAYLMPLKKMWNTGLLKSWRELIFPVASMVVVMFVNPYGIKAVSYLFDSFQAGTFSIIQIAEMQKVSIPSNEFMYIILTFMFIFLACIEKKQDTPMLYLTAGFLPAAFMAVRNQMFLLLPCAAALSGILRPSGKLTEHLQKLRWCYFPIFILSFIFCIGEFISLDNCYTTVLKENNINSDVTVLGYDPALEEMLGYIEEGNVFVGFNYGGYLEYNEIQVYMDARPELYTKAVNGVSDQLSEYMQIVTDTEAVPDFLESWNFDYILVDKNVEPALSSYLENNNCGYMLLVDSESIALYGKEGVFNG